MQLQRVSATARTHLGEIAYTFYSSRVRQGQDAGENCACFLFHGFPESALEFEHIADACAHGGISTVVPDLPGYGQHSCKPRFVREYSAHSIALGLKQLVQQVAETHKIHSPCMLVGHDWGGLCATAVAHYHPEYVERLCLLNSPHLGTINSLPRLLARSPRQILLSWYIYLFQLPLLPERIIASPQQVRQTLRNTGASADRAQRCSDAVCGLDGSNTWYPLAYYRALGRGAWSGRFALQQPVRCVFGRHDFALSPHLAAPDPRLVPNARTIFLESAGHFVHVDDPGAVVEQLEHFVCSESAAGDI